jgi:hypothetical protein
MAASSFSSLTDVARVPTKDALELVLGEAPAEGALGLLLGAGQKSRPQPPAQLAPFLGKPLRLLWAVITCERASCHGPILAMPSARSKPDRNPSVGECRRQPRPGVLERSPEVCHIGTQHAHVLSALGAIVGRLEFVPDDPGEDGRVPQRAADGFISWVLRRPLLHRTDVHMPAGLMQA